MKRPSFLVVFNPLVPSVRSRPLPARVWDARFFGRVRAGAPGKALYPGGEQTRRPPVPALPRCLATCREQDRNGACLAFHS